MSKVSRRCVESVRLQELFSVLCTFSQLFFLSHYLKTTCPLRSLCRHFTERYDWNPRQMNNEWTQTASTRKRSKFQSKTKEKGKTDGILHIARKYLQVFYTWVETVGIQKRWPLLTPTVMITEDGSNWVRSAFAGNLQVQKKMRRVLNVNVSSDRDLENSKNACDSKELLLEGCILAFWNIWIYHHVIY